MSVTTRVYVGRLAGLTIFDPMGDPVGRVRDVVITFSGTQRPRAVGLVVEVSLRRRVFMPMTRVTSVDAGQVITTGLVNLRRFEQRQNESLAVAELFDRSVKVSLDSAEVDAVVEDIGLERLHTRDWVLTRVSVREKTPAPASGFSRLRRRRGQTHIVDISQVTGLRTLDAQQGAARSLLESLDGMRAADVAEILHDLTPPRRAQVAASLHDDRLADVLEELPEEDQVLILATLEDARAADVLEAMQPDDAADLLLELPKEAQEQYLQLMEPEEADDLRRLLTYAENTAGGLMTTEPVIMAPEATIAEALANVRRAEISPAIAATVFVCRAPQETPTGKYLGTVHIQRLLREPPHGAVGSIIDKTIEPLRPDASIGQITRELATYNLVCMPVVDETGHLLGAVSVDDLLDHILPEDWRESRATGDDSDDSPPEVTGA